MTHTLTPAMSENSPLLSSGDGGGGGGGCGDDTDEAGFGAPVQPLRPAPQSLRKPPHPNGVSRKLGAPAKTASAVAADSVPAVEATKKAVDPATTRFADYFVICGLDLDEGLEPDRFAGESHKMLKISLLLSRVWCYLYINPITVKSCRLSNINQ